MATAGYTPLTDGRVKSDSLGSLYGDKNDNDTLGLQRSDSRDSAIYDDPRGEGVGVEDAATAEGPNGRMTSTSTQSLDNDAL